MSFQFDQKSFHAKEANIVVVEPARHMQILYRSMLSASGVRSLRVFASAERAAESILATPPDIVLVDWGDERPVGEYFLDQFRDQRLYPVCLIPIIVMMSVVRKGRFNKAIRLGAHAVLGKPISSAKLFDYITWILASEFPMELNGSRYVVPNLLQRVDAEFANSSKFGADSMAEAQHMAQINSIQSDVDRILNSAFY
ncbi:CheY-like chemotaxis protein [Maritalea mobilis]|uniref:CheY-like chemotaxis protein n=1 Tax=Maritalea mobilis TaxID=483324 RepID=A0A4R6VSN3_9HYPH|nr:response regulator [Maritalea mobilis]TDQ66441.1 CheY-like chemotaxis protein [Maritalea mobilis]